MFLPSTGKPGEHIQQRPREIVFPRLISLATDPLSTPNDDPRSLLTQHSRLHRFRTPFPTFFPREKTQHPIRFSFRTSASIPDLAAPIGLCFLFVHALPPRSFIVRDNLQSSTARCAGTPRRLPSLSEWRRMRCQPRGNMAREIFIRGVVF